MGGGGAGTRLFRTAPALVCCDRDVCGRSLSWPVPELLSLCGFGGIYFGGFTYYRSNQPGADPVFWNNLHAKKFWEEIPALVKDGAAFLQTGGQKQGHFSQYAAVDDVEAASQKKTPAKRKTALPPKKSGPPARRSGSSENDAERDEDEDEK